MKKVKLIILTFAMLIPVNTYAKELTDINNHWAKTEIEESIANDIINGYADNTFKPNEGVTLAEYLKILIKSAKFDLIKEGNYWPDYFIKTAKQKGLILENEFQDYNKKLTRNEIARITARYINVEDVKKAKIKLIDIDEAYKEEIQKLANLNVIKGYEDKTYRGQNQITRAESIVIAKRATNERRRLISNRKYSENEKINLSNIVTKNDGKLREVKYKIENEKIYIYDYDRYSNLQGYEIKNENINNKKVVKVINAFIDEDSYTEIIYVPFEEIINQLIVRRGENKNITSIGGFDYEFTYFENKPYELNRISKIEEFSREAYMKIEIGKMWRDSNKFNNKEYIDEYKKEKLRRALEIEFGINHTDKILEYMLEKYEKKISRETYGIEEIEVKTFGSYTLNYHKKTDGNPVFYISKNN